MPTVDSCVSTALLPGTGRPFSIRRILDIRSSSLRRGSDSQFRSSVLTSFGSSFASRHSMALVFKITFEDTLRRWVVSESWDQSSISIGIQELEVKIRELFRIVSTAPIVITYIDKEHDVVTLEDDQDLLDACLLQRLNPLRVKVKLREDKPEIFVRQSIRPPEPVQDDNAEAFLKVCFPQSTLDDIRQFVRKYPQVVDMNMPAAELMRNVQLLKSLSGKEALQACGGCPATPAPFESAGHDHFEKKCTSEPASGSRRKSNIGKVYSTQIFHRGVQCDGCGMIPIEGPRFKSVKMYDYDLCSACFEVIGNDADFQRIDIPVCPVSSGFYHPSCPASWWQPRQRIGASARRGSFARGPYGWVPECPARVQQSSYCPSGEAGSKLDASFVEDVTVSDGAQLAPGTKFKKIWRLRNAGTIPWPQKTQLVRIGGDLLSSEEIVNLEIPKGGLPCSADIDVCVDLIAPEQGGCYMSHWRLISPTGHKFGHRVWVVIEVVHQDVESTLLQKSLRKEEALNAEEEIQALQTETKESDQMFEQEQKKKKETLTPAPSRDPMISNGKYPIASDSEEGKLKLVADTKKVEDMLPPENNAADEFNQISVELETGKNIGAEEPVVTLSKELLAQQENEQHENNSVAIDNEVDGFSVVGKPTENVGWYNITNQGSPESTQTVLLQEQSTENVVVDSMKSEQEMQLQSLESMGFTDLALNMDLLEKNNQDFLLTLDNLVEVANWDNMLKDLQDMGFSDKLMNCRLLLKNQGSMKRVVKDLVEMEKQKAGWQEVLKI